MARTLVGVTCPHCENADGDLLEEQPPWRLGWRLFWCGCCAKYFVVVEETKG